MNSKLLTKHCVPCEGGMPPLSKEEAENLLGEVDGWGLVEDGYLHLIKEFKFKDFVEAMEFVNKVAKLAESEGHHPNFDIRWNKVILDLWTHAISGLSENDFILAVKINALDSQ